MVLATISDKESKMLHGSASALFFLSSVLHVCLSTDLSRSVMLREDRGPREKFWLRWKLFCTMLCVIFCLSYITLMFVGNARISEIFNLTSKNSLLVRAITQHLAVLCLLLYSFSFYYEFSIFSLSVEPKDRTEKHLVPPTKENSSAPQRLPSPVKGDHVAKDQPENDKAATFVRDRKQLVGIVQAYLSTIGIDIPRKGKTHPE